MGLSNSNLTPHLCPSLVIDDVYMLSVGKKCALHSLLPSLLHPCWDVTFGDEGKTVFYVLLVTGLRDKSARVTYLPAL